MSNAYAQAFGSPIVVSDSYRTLAQQIDVATRKPHLAAEPGTSKHGLGYAVDVAGGIEKVGSPQDKWIIANAEKFGWHRPPWARPNGSKPENWHLEWMAGNQA